MGTRPPNVIVLTCDELRGDCPGYAGNPDCRTPHLDRFAERGVVFTNHFAVHGKCVPSRIAMATGRYCHTDGYRTITQHLPPDAPNLLSFLASRGYETAVFGINHVWESLFDEHAPHAGYADWHSFAGHYHDMAFAEYVAPEPGAGARVQPGIDAPFACGTRLVGRIGGFNDDARTAQAVDYLTRTRDRTRPFYLHVNLSKPHPAYEAPEPYFSMYDPEAIVPFPHQLPRGAPLPLRAMREIRAGGDPPERALRELQAVYYAMVSKVESLVGRILDAIDAEGLLDESIVVFTSDHGDFAGQYGMHEKWDTCMADCILHVPLIVRAPDLPRGARVEGLTEHVDLVPTICAMLGAPPTWGVHGGSLLPIVAGRRTKPAVFADGGHEEEMWPRLELERREKDGSVRPLDDKQRTYRDVPASMARTKMVRTQSWKLVQRVVGGDELYDLAADPQELVNLHDAHRDDPRLARVVLDLQRSLIDWCLRTDTDRPYQVVVGA